ncbi:MAG: CPBP family intramembrane metalloprotease [Acidobacteriaceae bacterium]
METTRTAALVYRSIFVALILCLASFTVWRALHPGPQHAHAPAAMRPLDVLIGELIATTFVAVLTIAAAYVERVSLADLGIPLKEAFQRRFWIGALWGFVALSVVIGAMEFMRAADLGHVVDAVPLELKNGVLYALGFIGTALFEELLFRGYLLWLLTRVLGFWPAALVSSLIFGAVHTSNQGEAWYGIVSVMLVGLLFCLFVQRTGNLWFPIGFHFAWDWAETYFYGSPDSGNVASGSLFRTNFHGPVWVTGGSVGPEGSAFCTMTIVLTCVLFAALYRQRKYFPEQVVPKIVEIQVAPEPA